MREKLMAMPKIDLHLHLDGSIPLEIMATLANKNIIEVKKETEAPFSCANLNEYLTKFELPIQLMQTKEHLIQVTKGLLKELKKQNIIYAEIRFAPQNHTKYLNQEEVVQAVIDVLNEEHSPHQLILCLMRNGEYHANLKTIDVAFHHLNKGVCAVDLAGPESLYRNEEFQALFHQINQYHIPFTIHAGEADGYQSVESAMDMGATRIGHGVRSIENSGTVKRLIKEHITLEICPSSNIQTKTVKEINQHPIYELVQKGVMITVNTDNMTVSHTTLVDEYLLLMNAFPFTIEDFIQFNRNAIQCSFIREEKKQQLYEQLNQF